jgi:hypothetical protein
MDGDGIDNLCDTDLTGGADCNQNGVDDTCDPDQDGDGLPDACDDDIDGDGIDNLCDTDLTGGADCNQNGVDDSCDVDTDGDLVIDECDNCPLDPANDADQDGHCGDVDNCDLYNPDQADCNANGIGDLCEVADGSLPDCNGNGIPDACDLQDQGADCNENGYLDSCEIDSGFGTDCDGDGMLDSCLIDLMGAFVDCDGNGMLDTCELASGGIDCNGNGVLDSCDIDSGGSADLDGNGIPDECLADAVYNQSDGSYWDTLAEAMANANEGDTLLVPEAFFEALDGLELTLQDLTLRSLGQILLDGMLQGVVLGGDTTLATLTDQQGIWIDTMLEVATGQSSTLQAGMVTLGLGAHAEIPAGAQLSIESGGQLLSFGETSLHGGLLLSDSGIHQTELASLSGFGTIAGHMANAGAVTVSADMQFTHGLSNTGIVTMQSGVLTVFGQFENYGVVLGDPSGGFTGGDLGLTVIGDLFVGQDGSLSMPGDGGSLRVSGNASVAINDAQAWNMATSELRMVGEGDIVQELETLGEDLGAQEAGFDVQGAGMPIGLLRLGPAATTVQLVDAFDNDGLGNDACEVLYVDTLQLDAGAVLVTDGCRVYCRELILGEGAVIDHPDDVVIVEPDTCPGDLGGPDGVADGLVNIEDLLLLFDGWGSDGGDCNGDGLTNIEDLLILIGGWGDCS